MIKVKGKIAGVDVDLEIEGFSQELFKQLSQLLTAKVAKNSDVNDEQSDSLNTQNTTETSKAPVPQFPISQQYAQIALQYLTDNGDTSSSILIEHLGALGCSDQEIKKSLMALRESDQVTTYKSDDGQQRFYRLKIQEA